MGFAYLEGLTPGTFLNENGSNLVLSNKSKRLKPRNPVL